MDHVITDPPYEAEAHTLQRRTKRYVGGGKYVAKSKDESLTFDPMTPDIRTSVSLEFGRISRRWVLVFCQIEAIANWRDSLCDGGLKYKRACIWRKLNGQPQLTGDRPGMGYETFVAAHSCGKSRWNGGGRHGVYDFLHPDSHGRREDRHPTTKPLPLMEALIRDFTDPGETVLDPFAGSGTTGVACIRLGRNFIGIERDPKYAALARKRLEEAREQPDLIAVDQFARKAKTKRQQTAFVLEAKTEPFTPAFLPAEGDDNESAGED